MNKNSNKKLLIALAAAAAATLSGCYAVPVGPNGEVVLVSPPPTYPASTPAPAPTPWPALLHARLYPVNDEANETGVLAGTVTNMQTGKGRFSLNVRGEMLVGEATRISGNDRKGVANAYGRNGTYMSCEYLMNTPYQGTGTCTMSNGARYSVHVGS